MAPKKYVTSSSKSKWARVVGTSLDLDIPPYLEGLGWTALLHISGNYYPDLVQEFYANMTYKTNKDLQTIISTIKGVRIILNMEYLETVLRILDNGNLVTVDSYKKIIDEDPELEFRYSLQTLVQKGGSFSEVHIVDIYLLDKLFNRSPLSLSSLIIQKMRNTGCHITKKRDRSRLLNSQLLITAVTHGTRRVWIPTSEEDRLRDRNLAGFRKIKKTTQIGLGPSSSQPVQDDDEADESYNPSDNEEDEAGA
ncbi:hypothetical protein M9H77_03057 [Catharanthus roseus]|uniref:Uncharacterized protein n=1 Tax=Catharanthus roseus TaxID=4058 RepID=A0ACC0CA37_CATRO|nr:hypothetical protein M9H77_03057 [Catharanthus roseus]